MEDIVKKVKWQDPILSHSSVNISCFLKRWRTLYVFDQNKKLLLFTHPLTITIISCIHASNQQSVLIYKALTIRRASNQIVPNWSGHLVIKITTTWWSKIVHKAYKQLQSRVSVEQATPQSQYLLASPPPSWLLLGLAGGGPGKKRHAMEIFYTLTGYMEP